MAYQEENDWATHMYDLALYLELDDRSIEIERYNQMPKDGQLAYITSDLMDVLKVKGAAALVKDG